MPNGKDDKAKPGEAKEREPMPMFAIGAGIYDEEPRLARTASYEDTLVGIAERIQVGDTADGVDALRDLVKLVDGRGANDPRHRIAEIETRQGIYLAASGTLTQFNGIIAAALATALVTLDLGSLRFAFGAALVMHVLAAFFLCWAARPVAGTRETSPVMALMGQVTLVDHTFRNYQRGWRMTMLALTVTSVAGAIFVLRHFGIEVGGLLSPSSFGRGT